jgi:hypothetical protein
MKQQAFAAQAVTSKDPTVVARLKSNAEKADTIAKMHSLRRLRLYVPSSTIKSL